LIPHYGRVARISAAGDTTVVKHQNISGVWLKQSGPNIDGNITMRYITVFLLKVVAAESAELTNLEPYKMRMLVMGPVGRYCVRRKEQTDTLFESVQHLVDSLAAEKRTPSV
jgi:hypothetical protein